MAKLLLDLDPKITHYSLDIETLGTGKDAIVVAIGCTRLNNLLKGTKGINEFYATLLIDEQFKVGKRTITDGTIRFWFEQARQTQLLTFPPASECVHVSEALRDLGTFLRRPSLPGPLRVWTKGPAFDGAIIESLSETLNYACPVNYGEWLDVRVIELLTGEKVPRIEFGAHHALIDAEAQGNFIARALNL